MSDSYPAILMAGVSGLVAAITGGAAGLVSAVIAHRSTLAKTRLDLASEYDKKLQEGRLEAYKKLWAMLEPLARYGRDAPVTHAVIRSISDQSRAWYFQTGGIYLTERSRKPYFEWKKAMQPVLDDPAPSGQPDVAIRPERLEPILEAGSELRTALSDDIRTKLLSRV